MMDGSVDIQANLIIRDPVLLAVFCTILFLFVSIYLSPRRDIRLRPSLFLFDIPEQIDRSIESGKAITLDIAHKGLGTSGIVGAASSFDMLGYETHRVSRLGRCPSVMCADGIVAAVAMGALQGESTCTKPQVLYTGPDPFLAAANIALYSQINESPAYSYGQASVESTLLGQDIEMPGISRGGTIAPLGGLLLSAHPENAIFGAGYYMAPIYLNSQSDAQPRLHNWLCVMIPSAFIVELLLKLLGHT
ncbi:MAG: hypothetical protein LLG44_04205 [Chloroflexi bacterium]|nr:hypothetical protein [Chloroflexota bacterium]